ncbi:MAG: hypothetical protein ACTHK3_12760 [Solirubrobacterales bacterium]
MRGRAVTLTRRLRDDLDRSLFLPSPPDGFRFRGWEGAFVLVALLVLLSVIQLLRAGPSGSLHGLWAEDGPIYLNGALNHGFFDNVTTPYAEYLVVIPRLIGEVGAAVPLRDAPVAMNVAAILVVSLSVLALWFASAGHIRSPYLRALLLAAAIAPAVSGGETVVTATNAPWTTSFVVFWLLVWRPAAIWSACLGALLVLATGLSSPVIFFFIPLAALRAIAIRDRRDALIAGAFGLALAIQLPVTASSSEHVADPTWTVNILTTFLQRIVNGSVLGLELGSEAWTAWGWPFLIAITIGLTVYFAVLALRVSSGRLLATIAIATAVVMFLGSAYKRALGDLMVWPVNASNVLGARYAVVPALLLISAALVLLDARLRSGRGRPWPAIATAAVLLVAIGTSFDVSEGRTMPPWGESLRKAAAACRSEGLTEAPVPIVPVGMTMTITCDHLESATGPAPTG